MPSLKDIKNTKRNFIKDFEPKPYRSNNMEGKKNIKDSFLDSKDNDNVVLELDCEDIVNWKFNDRPKNELGDINTLAKDFKTIGQQQPCIVRNYSEKYGFKYELIVGERRWHAAKLAGLKLKAIVRELSDSDAAIIQATENINRKDLSDYAKGMSYYRLINSNIITKNDLIKNLNITKQQMSSLLSFSKINSKIADSINDFSKISARTAETIKQLSSRGEEYIEEIIKLSEKLKEGKLGHERLKNIIENTINSSKDNRIKIKASNNRFYSKSGEYIFSWVEKDNISSIHFAKDIEKLLEDRKYDIKKDLIKYIETLFK